MRAYAKLRGCNVSSVSRAIAEGKLQGATIVGADGKLKIRSARVADEAWQRNTRPLPNRPPEHPPQRPASMRPIDVEGGATTLASAPDYFLSRALREAALARKDAAAAELAEMELAKIQGYMVDAREVRAALGDAVTRAKTHLLGVPSKFRQRCPHIAPVDLRELMVLMREALEELADGKLLGAPPAEGSETEA